MGQQVRGRQREGRQAAEEQETGKQTGRQGLDNRRVVRQARVRKQAGSAFYKQFRSCGKALSTRDDQAETEWRERISIEGSQVKVVGLIRGDQGCRQVNGKTRGGVTNNRYLYLPGDGSDEAGS